MKSERVEQATQAAEERGEALALRRGALRIPRRLYELHFAGRQAVILLAREDDLLILPVAHSGGGGHLLKIVNAAGDRSVQAAEILRSLGVEEEFLEGFSQATVYAHWSPEDAGLVVENVAAVVAER